MTVIIGLTDTNFHEKQKDPGLPNDSYDRSISRGSSEMRERRQDPSKFTSVADYSSQLVQAIEEGKSTLALCHGRSLNIPNGRYQRGFGYVGCSSLRTCYD